MAVCLGELGKHLFGKAPGDRTSPALDWKPLYQAYVDAGLPSGAEIPGGG